jgi:hypothetical protein
MLASSTGWPRVNTLRLQNDFGPFWPARTFFKGDASVISGRLMQGRATIARASNPIWTQAYLLGSARHSDQSRTGTRVLGTTKKAIILAKRKQVPSDNIRIRSSPRLGVGPCYKAHIAAPENLGSKFSRKGLFGVGAKSFFARGIDGMEGWPSGLRHRS